jgi:hypothetical protein
MSNTQHIAKLVEEWAGYMDDRNDARNRDFTFKITEVYDGANDPTYWVEHEGDIYDGFMEGLPTRLAAEEYLISKLAEMIAWIKHERMSY